MEPEAGGNARSGSNEVSAYPWAAHYVPVPGPHAPLVRELFEELGVVKDGRWEERHLCHAPQERLFLHGRWQAGFEPQVGPTARDRDQVARFEHRMAEYAATGTFKVPTGNQVAVTSLDAISMAQWLSQQGFDSPWLRWLVDYACRDDYGARAGETAAWAGIHYFASRAPQEHGPLTWPEGNGWITTRLLAIAGDKVKAGHIVTRVARQGRLWLVSTPDARWVADVVIFAAPSFLAARVIENGPATPDFQVLALAHSQSHARPLAVGTRRTGGLGQRDRRLAITGLRCGDAPVAADARAAHGVDVLLAAGRRVTAGQPAVAADAGLGVAGHAGS